MRAACAGVFAGLEFPKPAGARPRSVVLPCASQARGLLPARCGALLLMEMPGVRFEFGIAEGGVATWDLAFTAPSELCCVGLSPTEFVTCAPLSAAGVRWTAPRLMAWPLTKVLRFATVTAFTLCALTKLMLRTFVLKTFTLRINVLCTLITVMKLRRQGNQGKNGSPNPSGNQPM